MKENYHCLVSLNESKHLLYEQVRYFSPGDNYCEIKILDLTTWKTENYFKYGY